MQTKTDEEIKLDSKRIKSFQFQNRELLDNYVIIAVTNTEGIITHVSTKLCVTFSYKKSELIGRPYTFLVKKEFISKFNAQFEDIQKTKTIWNGETKNISHTNTTIWTDTIITPLFSNQDENVGFIFASNDITKEKKLKKVNEDNLLKTRHDKSVLDFMPSLSSAILLKTSTGLHKILWIILYTIIILGVWANYSKIDDIVRTEGKIVTSTNIQNISTFTGGTLKDFYVKEGDTVKKGQQLLKISDVYSKSEFEKNQVKLISLLAKTKRLEAQANHKEIEIDPYVLKNNITVMNNEIDLFNLNRKKINATIEVLKEQLIQRKSDLDSSYKQISSLQRNKNSLNEEIEIKKTLVKQGIIAKIDVLKSQRELNNVSSEIKSLKIATTSQKSAIKEINDSINETVGSFHAESKNQLVDVYSEIQNIKEELKYNKVKINETTILSPSDGVINKIYVKTQGEAIASGTVIAQIIPKSNYLVATIKVSPSSIGFLYVGQDVRLKLRAYDFSLYGAINGKISYISADTLPDELDQNIEVYTVHIKANKKYVGENKKLIAKTGMTVDADILVGKKSILEYIFKPIIKSLGK